VLKLRMRGAILPLPQYVFMLLHLLMSYHHLYNLTDKRRLVRYTEKI